VGQEEEKEKRKKTKERRGDGGRGLTFRDAGYGPREKIFVVRKRS